MTISSELATIERPFVVSALPMHNSRCYL